MRLLIIDNYDSFTWNLAHLIAQITGHLPAIRANDAISMEEFEKLNPDAVILSPGPGRPERDRDFGICGTILRESDRPILGVCLGHQGIAFACDGSIAAADRVMHGITSRILHDGADLFRGIPQGFDAVRYHSLIVAKPLPSGLECTAWTEDGEIMGLRHKHRPLWGVQFHPESIRTEHGRQLVTNFLECAQIRSNGVCSGWSSRGEKNGGPQAPARPELQRKFDFFVEPEDAYLSLFSDDENSYWLDSSLTGPGLARFSFIGGCSIPGSFLIEYRTREKQLTISQCGNRTSRRQALLDYLQASLRNTAGLSPCDGFHGGFVGYFGFEMKADCGFASPHDSELPDAMLLYTPASLVFDHQEKTVSLFTVSGHMDADLSNWAEQLGTRLRRICPASAPPANPEPPPTFVPKRDYETHASNIRECLAEIRDGETYEVCLTNTFQGEPMSDPLDYYRRLRRSNPAPYSAFLRFGSMSVACSSPERFLRIASGRIVSSKPIKGTARRDPDIERDHALKENLARCAKNRSEHLMIVDLVRNDLGKVCEPGTVNVSAFMAVESYAAVHQLVSTIEGQLRPDCDAIDCLRAAFPGGSMTGAPKHRTLGILDRLENGPRGIYSGCLGYLSLDGSADFNIVIRTAVITKDGTSIGSGGAIVALSEPAGEWDEMMSKIRPLLAPLN